MKHPQTTDPRLCSVIWLTRLAVCIATSVTVQLLGAYVDRQPSSEEHHQLPGAPNIVFLMVDDMGIGDAEPYQSFSGLPDSLQLATPHLAQLAAEGMQFTDAHSASSMCTPSRYGLQLGRYPIRSVKKGGAASRIILLPRNRRTIGRLMQDAGYRTALIGKWHLGTEVRTLAGGTSTNFATADAGLPLLLGPMDYGYNYTFGLPNGIGIQNDAAFVENGVFVKVADEIPYAQRWPSSSPWPGHDRHTFTTYTGSVELLTDDEMRNLGDVFVDQALDFIEDSVRNSSEQPFFLVFSHTAPHVPHLPPQEVNGEAVQGAARWKNGRVTAREGDEMIHEIDVIVGQLKEQLNRLGIADNTLFIFTSDNGGGRSARLNLRGKKGDIYEGGHRVPFIAHWPDVVPAGTTVTHMIGLQDMYATLAEMVTIPLKENEAEDSVSFYAVLQDPNVPTPRQTMMNHNHRVSPDHQPRQALRDGPWKLIVSEDYINDRQVNPLELYNLDNDLLETTNLLDDPDQQARVSQMTQELIVQYNQGFSRDLQLHATASALVEDDGQTVLRNDRDGAIGYEFTVTADTDIEITHLGMWDAAAADVGELDYLQDGTETEGTPDGLVEPHTIRLFDVTTGDQLAMATVSDGNLAIVEGEFRYVPLSQLLTLTAGHRYALTMSTTGGSGDLFHHYEQWKGDAPLPNGHFADIHAIQLPSDSNVLPASRKPDNYDSRVFDGRMFVGPNLKFVTVNGRDPSFWLIYNPKGSVELNELSR